MNRPRASRPVLIAVAIGLSAVLTACTGGSGDSQNPADSGSVADDSAPQEVTDEGEGSAPAGEDGSAEAAGLDPANLPEPVATGEIPAVVEGDDAGEATMTVNFYGLKREGQTVVGQFSFAVNSDASDEAQWIYDYLGKQSWHPFLVDSVNLKRHGVVGSAGGKAQTNSQGPKFRPGQTFYAFAVFAAPPEDVTTMDVSVIDGMPLVTGVEVQ
ncbi:hypothetical protein GCM10022261_31490 [Brevibacterium daeguense]|uniref:Uncharacterized protein n=1 Tax=Brevibacterium daeguense TaxID=909936 RepID=A0ABP8ENP7_9MICO|nr:hypothetical protein [Brevibacterium daeguense]